jgi:WD40 repeat protein
VPLVFIILALLGCGEASNRRSAHEAEQLRLQVPGMLAVDQRRALLYAVAAQQLDPTVAGNWLLQSVDAAFRGVGNVFVPTSSPAITAVRTSTAVITSDTAGHLETWDASSGQLLGSVPLKAPLVWLAASPSPYLVASADAAGQIAMWDLEDPRHPVELPLQGSKVAGKRVVALGFAARATHLLALTPTGKLYVFDVLSRKRLAVRSLQEAHGPLPWVARPAALRVSAASFVTEAYSPNTTLLVATPHDGVARIDLQRLSGSTVIPGAEISGTVSAIAEYSNAEKHIFLGTSQGTDEWNSKTHSLAVEHRGPSVGLALQGSVLTAGNAQGLASIDLATAETTGTSLSSYGGRPARTLTSGPGGAVELGRDGSISLLKAGESGINIETSNAESSIVAEFGPEGDLLETSGSDANHVESLMTVRPGVPGAAGSEVEPNRVMRRFFPSKSWWPQETSEPHGLFIDDADLDNKYVVAGGQDPTGTAVVLVWDAKTGQPLHRLPLTESGLSTQGETKMPSLVSQVMLFPKRHLIAAYSSLQELIVLWSTDSWKRVTTIDVGPIGSFSVSGDESTLLVDSLSDQQSNASAGNTKTRLLFISVGSGKTKREVVSEGTEFAAYSPNGTILEVQRGGILRQMAADARQSLKPPLTIEYGTPSSLAWKPHSKVIAVGLGDRGVRLVDLSTGRVSDALPPTTGTEPVDVSFSPNGQLLAASNATTTGEVHSQASPSIWRLNDNSLEGRACQLAGGGVTRAEWMRWMPNVPFVPLCHRVGH